MQKTQVAATRRLKQVYPLIAVGNGTTAEDLSQVRGRCP